MCRYLLIITPFCYFKVYSHQTNFLFPFYGSDPYSPQCDLYLNRHTYFPQPSSFDCEEVYSRTVISFSSFFILDIVRVTFDLRI